MIVRLGLNFAAHCLAGMAFGALGAYVVGSELAREGDSLDERHASEPVARDADASRSERDTD